MTNPGKHYTGQMVTQATKLCIMVPNCQHKHCSFCSPLSLACKNVYRFRCMKWPASVMLKV